MRELHFMIKEKGDCSIRVRSGDQVRITHAGFHERNGQPTKFDGNIEGEPLKVTVGKRKVIAGMDQVCELPRTLTQATPQNFGVIQKKPRCRWGALNASPALCRE